MEEKSSSESKSRESSIMGHLDDKKVNEDKMESEIKLENEKAANAAGTLEGEESMCETSSSKKLAKWKSAEEADRSGVDEVKSGKIEVEEGEDDVEEGEEDVKEGQGRKHKSARRKASLQECDPQPKVADEPPHTEDEEADSTKKIDNKDLAALDEDEEVVGLRGLGSSVRKVWGRESFSPVREVWGEEGFNERDNEQEEEQEGQEGQGEEQEEQEEDNNEVEEKNEGSVTDNYGRSIGKRNLRK